MHTRKNPIQQLIRQMVRRLVKQFDPELACLPVLRTKA
jgi:hypothetical protein